jgi:2-polyprenyl-3-methyl-5-hydroxy-6-metoxy-1,4-benzoquinol methylase
VQRLTETPRYPFKPDPWSSHAVILRWSGPGHGRRLLDVGAADGLLSRQFTAAGWRVTALEGDPGAARLALPHCERVIVVDLDRQLPTLDGPFDLIVCGDVLEHLRDPLGVLRALTRHLSPGGQILISVPNVAHLWIRLNLLIGRFEYADRGILDRTHLRFFTWRSLLRLLGHADLRVVRRTVTPVPLHQVVPPRWHGRALTALHALAAAAARACPRLLGYQFVVLATPAAPG